VLDVDVAGNRMVATGFRQRPFFLLLAGTLRAGPPTLTGTSLASSPRGAIISYPSSRRVRYKPPACDGRDLTLSVRKRATPQGNDPLDVDPQLSPTDQPRLPR
jgi:hypothetical protein